MDIAIADEFLKPISGKRLTELFQQYSSVLFPELVSQSPELATERAENFLGVKLTQAATDIPALAEIRNLIFDCAGDSRVIDSFSIVLPHTHWRKRAPVIYSFDKANNRYVIGTHYVSERQIYIPVSFVFYKGSIIPYEWADETVEIAVQEFSKCIDIIQKVAKNYNYSFYPFGINIDFRFKTTLFSVFGGTIEIPEEDENSPHAHCSYILAQTDYERDNLDFILTQVAWHPRSDKLLSLTDNEAKILTELRVILHKTSSDAERQAFLSNIEDTLNSK